LDALADEVLSLARAVTVVSSGESFTPSPLQREMALLGTAMRRLATMQPPWPSELVVDVRTATDHTMASAVAATADHVPVVRALLHATAVDLVALVGGDTGESAER
jgi:hypothetical protein